MLSSIGAFLLLVFAFFATVLFLLNPVGKLEEWDRGKKQSEINEAIKEKWDKEPGDAVLMGCGFLILTFFVFFYAFVVNPLAVVSALLGKIGNQPLAYAMLVLIGLNCVRFVRRFAENRKKTGSEEKAVDEVIKVGNPTMTALTRFYFFLPDLYLWYLFLVVIGVLS